MASNKFFLDANIFLRHLTHDNPKLYIKATNIFEKIGLEEVEAYTSTLVLHDVIYVLEKIYSFNRLVIVRDIKKLLKIGKLFILDLEKDNLILALRDYKNTRVDFPDCVYKQTVLENDMKLLSFDEEFKKIKVERIEEI
ncbi:MAG: PilT protein domain protein [Candidatus Woesebacteria bacterium GW2011_GWB1_39_10b]|uniref:Twitching motility protein PilT n=2 Tax=Microgenomates group TaxID=1794810 RepID=A0A0H4TAI5_9BACT|nr:twitching motility protein PilT [uncultured Microgenomates bacterium Rifle_16ft_4_minimus_954]KKQ51903.1 MAG: hypothetical protein US72_C0011G0002 [Microgenomates group bacterium GW2011_GWC1_38_12]KKQ93888.1 MAG: PilT protein domain protein [Candidatus Woesebacteria bacterium GW2011_GWB1_39_10b]